MDQPRRIIDVVHGPTDVLLHVQACLREHLPGCQCWHHWWECVDGYFVRKET